MSARLSRPCRWSGGPNASVLDRAISVLSRSKKAAVAENPEFVGPAASTGVLTIRQHRGSTRNIMASARSRLVTWSYTPSKLPWKTVLASAPGPGPFGDPRSPPRRGSPLCGVGLGCSLAVASASPWSRKDAGRGQRARISYLRLSRWVLRGQKHVGGLRAHGGWRGG